MSEEYPRYLILGTIEHERYMQDAYYCGWVTPTPILTTLKQKMCRHEFTLWCTNVGVKDARLTSYRKCMKCGKEEFR